ncbi:signal recognition particle protein [Candidatus Spongiihabitans sp.]|uniref:signal recognition particle protein n=1 Tax=Candidatus Spongiihabitans sp. TaxID=3101308 RepID=UPI003C6F77BA
MFNQLSDKLRGTIKTLSGRGRLTEANIADAMREVRIALLEADVSLEVTKSFIEQVKVRAVGTEVSGSLQPGQAVIKIVQDELVKLMGDANEGLNLSARPPATIFIAGLQGAGKTTTVGKLGHFLKIRQKKSVLVVSTDIYRPAAIDQLKVIADDLELNFYPGSQSQNPVDIAMDALRHARKNSIDVVVVDTAGRLHVDKKMMDEARALHQAVQPIETLFVVDSMSGQDAVNSAKAFAQALPLTGVILTKTDGDARGGAVLSVRQATGKPIKFLGTGEAMDALQPFHPDRVASRILGMGDVLSLVEEVERKVDKDQAEKLAKRMTKGKGFDLEDFRDQMMQIQNMGGIMGVVEKLPGMDKLPQKALDQVAGKKTDQAIAIVNSMTPHERKFPAVIRASRKQRIAAGSGTQVQEVNRLLKQFLQMQKMMKKMRKEGAMKGLLNQFRGAAMPGGRF